MIAQDKHIIEKVHCQIHVSSLEAAHEVKRNISDVLRSQILPYLEQYLDRLNKRMGKYSVRLNECKLSLHFDAVNWRLEDLQEGLKKQLDVHVKAKMEEVLRADSTTDDEQKVVTSDDRQWEAIIHFLSTGRVAWWLSNAQLDDLLSEDVLLERLSADRRKVEWMLQACFRNAAIRKRLLTQFTKKTLLRAVYMYMHSSDVLPASISAQLDSWEARDKVSVEQLMELVLVTAFKKASKPLTMEEVRIQVNALQKSNAWVQWLEYPDLLKWINAVTVTSVSQSPQPFAQEAVEHDVLMPDVVPSKGEDEASKTNESPIEVVEVEAAPSVTDDEKIMREGIYVENAGLIILHPFLLHFFEKVGLLNEDKNITDTDLAVHCLHYLATGREKDWEHNMVFEKYLCGVPLEQPISKEVELSDAIRTECELLLQSVIEYWTIIGNSDSEALRNEFLSRSGKLTLDDVSPRLIVERKTLDVLVDRLPWSISIVKLPWLQQLIYTTW